MIGNRTYAKLATFPITNLRVDRTQFTHSLKMTGLTRFVLIALVIQLLGTVLVLFSLQARARSTSLKALVYSLP